MPILEEPMNALKRRPLNVLDELYQSIDSLFNSVPHGFGRYGHTNLDN